MGFFDQVLGVTEEDEKENDVRQSVVKESLLKQASVKSDDEAIPFLNFKVTVQVLEASDLAMMEIKGRCSPFFHPCVRSHDESVRFWLTKSITLVDCDDIPVWKYSEAFTSKDKQITTPIQDLALDVYFWEAGDPDEKTGKVHINLSTIIKAAEKGAEPIWYDILDTKTSSVGKVLIQITIGADE